MELKQQFLHLIKNNDIKNSDIRNSDRNDKSHLFSQLFQSATINHCTEIAYLNYKIQSNIYSRMTDFIVKTILWIRHKMTSDNKYAH